MSDVVLFTRNNNGTFFPSDMLLAARKWANSVFLEWKEMHPGELVKKFLARCYNAWDMKVLMEEMENTVTAMDVPPPFINSPSPAPEALKPRKTVDQFHLADFLFKGKTSKSTKPVRIPRKQEPAPAIVAPVAEVVTVVETPKVETVAVKAEAKPVVIGEVKNRKQLRKLRAEARMAESKRLADEAIAKAKTDTAKLDELVKTQAVLTGKTIEVKPTDANRPRNTPRKPAPDPRKENIRRMKERSNRTALRISY